MEKRTLSFSGLRPLFQISSSITKKACTKHDGFLASLLLDWPLIVGAELGAKAQPQKISFPPQQNKGGTIILAVGSGSDSMMVYHMHLFILDKVNTFLGHKALDHVRVVQTKIMATKIMLPKTQPAQLSSKDQTDIEAFTSSISDTGLKDALQRLGESLYLKDKPHDH